jgi:hypothetical protein
VRLALIAAVLAIATAARAADDEDKPEIQRMLFVESGELLTFSTVRGEGGIGSVFDVKRYDALGSGTPSVLVIRIQIVADGTDTPVAEQVLQRTAVYDVWDERYILRLEQPGSKKQVIVKTPAEALTRMTALQDIPVARLDALPYDKVFVMRMVVELNPIPKEVLAELRRYLSQGTGGGIDRGGALFGSFVSIFYNPKMAEAERVLRIQSRPFYRARP